MPVDAFARSVLTKSAADARAARDLAAQFGSAKIYDGWSSLAAVTGSAGNVAAILEDTGTHTDPVVGSTVSNSGFFEWSASPAGWRRFASTEAAKAQAWAEGPGEPGGPGTKSAKDWATAASSSALESAAARDLVADLVLPQNKVVGGTLAAAEALFTVGTKFAWVHDGLIDVRERTVDGSTFLLSQPTTAALAAPTGASMINTPYGPLPVVLDQIKAPFIYAKKRGAVGDGVTDDWAVLDGLQDELEAIGGGTILYDTGVYALSKPLEGRDFVSHVGVCSGGDVANVLKGVWFKQLTDTPDSAGLVCVMSVRSKRHWTIADISFIGRSTGTSAPVGHVGLYVRGNNFTLRNPRIDRIRGKGLQVFQSYMGTIERPVAMRCQDYGFRIGDSSTSLTIISPAAWGTAGGYEITGLTYSTIISSACDFSDNPDGSFVGQGGQASPRAYVYKLSAIQGVTFISPGCEGARSKWMYAEGVNATIISPSIGNMIPDEANWTFMDVRGGPNGYSHIKIETPYGFHGVGNPLGNALGIVIERPAQNKVYITGRFRLNNITGPNAYTNEGIVIEGQKTVINLTQSSMIVGANTTGFIKQDASDIADVVVESGVKKLVIDAVAGATQKFTWPIDARKGFFMIQAAGEYSSSFSTAKLQIVDGTGTVLKTWSSTGNALTLDERAWIDTTEAGTVSGSLLSFVITTNNQSDVMKFSKLRLEYAEGQN